MVEQVDHKKFSVVLEIWNVIRGNEFIVTLKNYSVVSETIYTYNNVDDIYMIDIVRESIMIVKISVVDYNSII